MRPMLKIDTNEQKNVVWSPGARQIGRKRRCIHLRNNFTSNKTTFLLQEFVLRFFLLLKKYLSFQY